MIEALISISISSRQLCAVPLDYTQPIKCYQVAVGCPEYPTPVGTFEVKSIYTNAMLKSFTTNKNLGSEIIGSTLIDLGPNLAIPGTTLAVHGWKTSITPTMCSHGCIRLNKEDIKNVIRDYYFNSIHIKN